LEFFSSLRLNLVGLTPVRKPKTSYYDVHVGGVKNVLSACKLNRVKKLVHISALGADRNSKTEYLRTKSMAEELIAKSKIKFTIIRPSIVFAINNELVKQARNTTFMFSFPKITTKVQPIYILDLAKIVHLAVNNTIDEKRIEVAGPDKMTIFEMVKKIRKKKGFVCFPMPLIILRIALELAAFLKLAGITKDQIESLKINSTTDLNSAAKYIKLTNFDEWLKSTEI